MHIGSNDSMAFYTCDMGGQVGGCRVGVLSVVRRASHVHGRNFFMECYAVKLHTPIYSVRFSLTRLKGPVAVTHEVLFMAVCYHLSTECEQGMQLSFPFMCSYSRSTPQLTTPIVGLTTGRERLFHLLP
jgi:hypothetical protein